MKLRWQIYEEVAKELLRSIRIYHCILPEQVYLLFSQYEQVHIKNVISRLLNRRELFFSEKENCLLERNDPSLIDIWTLRAIWVLLDHFEGAGTHTRGEYPVVLSFIQGETLYDVVAVAPGEELRISFAMHDRIGEHSPCIMILESPKQRKQMAYSKDTVFCTVAPDGAIKYFEEKGNAIESI